jgi:hypothetical protein
MRLFGLKRYKARSKPYLSTQARFKRVLYAQQHKKDTKDDWRRTIFVDEAAIRTDGSLETWVTREKGQAYLKECLAPRFLGGGRSIMVWGAIWYGGRSELIRFDTKESEGKRKGVTAKIYRDQITKGELKRNWKHVNRIWRGFGGARIVEDNVRIHTSLENRRIAKWQKFRYLNHPPYSPDLNPIENCWGYLKRMIYSLPRHPTTTDELYETAKRLWNEIPQEVINDTVESMKERLKLVRSGHGWPTKY